MIGTNNASDTNNPEQIAEGVSAVVTAIHGKSPTTKVLLLGIFPRGKGANDSKRLIAEKVNQLLSATADNTTTFYLDIGAKFLAPDKSLIKGTTTDNLHLTSKGYEIWAEAIESKLKELTGDR